VVSIPWLTSLFLLIVLLIFFTGWWEILKEKRKGSYLQAFLDLGILGMLLGGVYLYTLWGVPMTSPRPSPFSTSRMKGEEIFQRRGCSTCHFLGGSEGVGPDLKGLWGKVVTFADNTTGVVDGSYLRESILYPERRIVKGYRPLMPSYAGVLSEEELETLILWLKDQK
jgi:cytochrome c2